MESSWYKGAVIYEVPVQAFCDSNGDGHGDWPGLIQELDYLRDLGVSAISLPLFYPSPPRGDGGTAFSAIGSTPYALAFASYGFYWFTLNQPSCNAARDLNGIARAGASARVSAPGSPA